MNSSSRSSKWYFMMNRTKVSLFTLNPSLRLTFMSLSLHKHDWNRLLTVLYHFYPCHISWLMTIKVHTPPGSFITDISLHRQRIPVPSRIEYDWVQAIGLICLAGIKYLSNVEADRDAGAGQETVVAVANFIFGIIEVDGDGSWAALQVERRKSFEALARTALWCLTVYCFPAQDLMPYSLNESVLVCLDP